MSELNGVLPLHVIQVYVPLVDDQDMCPPNSFSFKMNDVPKHVSFKKSFGFGVSPLLRSCTTSPLGINSVHVQPHVVRTLDASGEAYMNEDHGIVGHSKNASEVWPVVDFVFTGNVCPTNALRFDAA